MKLKGMYLIHFENGIKIGMSNDIESRIQYYKSPWCKRIKAIYVQTCPFPRKVENKIINYYKKYIVSGTSKEFLIGVDPISVLKTIYNFKESRESGQLLFGFQFKTYKYDHFVSALQEIDLNDL